MRLRRKTSYLRSLCEQWIGILRGLALSHYAVLPLLVLIGGLWVLELFLTY